MFEINKVGAKVSDYEKFFKKIFGADYGKTVVSKICYMDGTKFRNVNGTKNIKNNLTLDHCYIIIYYEGGGHAISGFICNDEYYIYDSHWDKPMKCQWNNYTELKKCIIERYANIFIKIVIVNFVYLGKLDPLPEEFSVSNNFLTENEKHYIFNREQYPNRALNALNIRNPNSKFGKQFVENKKRAENKKRTTNPKLQFLKGVITLMANKKYPNHQHNINLVTRFETLHEQ